MSSQTPSAPPADYHPIEKQVPTLLQFTLTLILTAVALFTASALYLTRSLEATELRLRAAITDATTPIKERQAKLEYKVDGLELIVTLLASKYTGMSPEDKQAVNNLLSKITYEDIKHRLKKPAQKRSLQELKQDKDVEQIGEVVTGLKWDGDHPAQVRFIEVKNSALDLSKIGLSSEGPDGCRSELLQLSEASGATVQVCVAHLESSRTLELTIVAKPESAYGL